MILWTTLSKTKVKTLLFLFTFTYYFWVFFSSLFLLSICSSFSFSLIVHKPCKFTEWNLINTQGSNEVPKVADFLGVSKSENHSDLVAFNDIQANDSVSDYLFPNNSIVPVQDTVVANSSSYDFQEKSNSLQSLTLSMGSGKGSSACETSTENTSIATVEAPPRRILDTFGQRTSIYRGVTRCAYFHTS